MNLRKKGTAKIYLLYVVTVLPWYNLLEMNTANKGKNLVINYNTYLISSNIIFISKSSSEWMTELRFNVPPATRSYGDRTSLIIIIITFFHLFKIVSVIIIIILKKQNKKTCTESSFCKSLYLLVYAMVVSLRSRHAMLWLSPLI